MSAKTVSVSLPESFVGDIDRAAKTQQCTRSDIVREALERYLGGSDGGGEWLERVAVDLLRTATITASQAASLLGVTRWEVVELMARHDISMAEGDAGTLQRELELLAAEDG